MAPIHFIDMIWALFYRESTRDSTDINVGHSQMLTRIGKKLFSNDGEHRKWSSHGENLFSFSTKIKHTPTLSSRNSLSRSLTH